MDRDQRRAETARSRLALVAARKRKRSQVRDQSRCTPCRAITRSMVRNRRGAQRLADKRGRGELPAAGGDRESDETKMRAVECDRRARRNLACTRSPRLCHSERSRGISQCIAWLIFANKLRKQVIVNAVCFCEVPRR